MRKGFYVVGFFEKDKPSKVSFMREKPFEIDLVEGRVWGKVISLYPTNKVADEWAFIYDKNISDIDKELELRKDINILFRSWCKERGRKEVDVLKEEVKE